MNELYMIHLDDYVRHIDDKLALYAMLRQLEAAIEKLPENSRTREAKRRMALFSPKLDELWESWSIPKRYLVSGEKDDLSAVMEDELTEPEDEGFYYGDESEETDALCERCAAELAKKFLMKASESALNLSTDLLNEYKCVNAVLGDQED